MTRSPDGPILITFSGLDGSGKTTQIEYLSSLLVQFGLRPQLLAFWDDVVVFSRYRERFVHRVFGSQPGVGAPGKPVARRDKNVRGGFVTFARHGLYLADAVNLRFVLRRAWQSAPVVILDRYIYDELANLPLANPLTRTFIRLVLALVPRPHVAYLLDADPETARMRKPEYSVNFMRRCRRAYLDLATIAGLTVIPPLSLPEAKEAVAAALYRVVGASAPPSPRAA